MTSSIRRLKHVRIYTIRQLECSPRTGVAEKTHYSEWFSKLTACLLTDKSLLSDSGWLGSAGPAVIEGTRVAPGPAWRQYPGHGRWRAEQQAGWCQHHQLGVWDSNACALPGSSRPHRHPDGTVPRCVCGGFFTRVKVSLLFQVTLKLNKCELPDTSVMFLAFFFSSHIGQ